MGKACGFQSFVSTSVRLQNKVAYFPSIEILTTSPLTPNYCPEQRPKGLTLNSEPTFVNIPPMKNLNYYVTLYKEQLQQGNIIKAHRELVRFVMQLRTSLMTQHSRQYSFSGILHGYIDYTYFYYSNTYLKSQQLKLGLVLNHLEMRFEVWLLGRTKAVQYDYWERLKDSRWNQGIEDMPKYYILSAVMEAQPDFDDLPNLRKQLEGQFLALSEEIIEELKALESAPR